MKSIEAKVVVLGSQGICFCQFWLFPKFVDPDLFVILFFLQRQIKKTWNGLFSSDFESKILK